MLCLQNAVAIKGIYDNGKITITDEPPVRSMTAVTITSLLDSIQKPKRILSGLEGKIITPDNFNDPLDDLKEMTIRNLVMTFLKPSFIAIFISRCVLLYGL